MKMVQLKRHKSWLMSGSIVILVVLWLASGQVSNDNPEPASRAEPIAAVGAPKNAVRVRTQSAEEVMRTIVINGKTEPARIVELAAETDGRVEFIGAKRGASLERGDIIVRLDERDRTARLAQARALVRQREVEYEARERLDDGTPLAVRIDVAKPQDGPDRGVRLHITLGPDL